MSRARAPGPRVCKDHPGSPAVVACASCDRPLCDPCFRFRLGGRPGCARCAYELTTRSQRRVSLAVAFLSLTFGAGFWLVRRLNLWTEEPLLVVLVAVAAPIVALVIGLSARDAKSPAVEPREAEEDAPADELSAPPARGSPYRAGARRVLLAASPRLSARATALVFGVSLATSAVLVPAELKLPRWIEAELVLGCWWLIVVATLATLLYRDFRLKDDWAYFTPWDRPKAGNVEKASKPAGSKAGWLDGAGGCGLDGCSSMDGEGCLAFLAVAVVLGVAVGAAWIVVELAMPLLFFILYALFMKAIARVSRDRHECAGRLGPSVGWGALWATIYLAPIAALAWGVHAVGR